MYVYMLVKIWLNHLIVNVASCLRQYLFSISYKTENRNFFAINVEQEMKYSIEQEVSSQG